TDRWQSGQLLRNLGDGTFEDVTASVGLDVKKLACCSLFADFDNDGDSDVFVGGTLEPSQYFENDQGKFRLDQSMTEEYEFVKFVVSGSVADINGDGCLDVYLSTYGLGTGDSTEWIGDSVRVKDQVKMRMKVERSHFFLDRAGAPNIVLLNKNGKLTRAEITDELAQWRNSYQTVWSDFDADGDQDLYLCNDFSPDRFLRNDTERGSFDLEFTDVSEKVVPGGTMGFGMGASWGDYNNDGLQDLYVSNMYSKAGNRIVEQVDNVDERVKVSARGNFLYQNMGEGKFKQVAGTEDGFQNVAQVGWSFGGQFGDFDNDGNLDLYVPSGFYTPPVEVRKEGDW
ncbi:VCBS repeat-containing protein, partial [bacterium]|nr:VCBS repeat-containing protein [bacterium]